MSLSYLLIPLEEKGVGGPTQTFRDPTAKPQLLGRGSLSSDREDLGIHLFCDRRASFYAAGTLDVIRSSLSFTAGADDQAWIIL